MASHGRRGGEEWRQRLFVALDLPEKLRAGLAAWGEEELVDPQLRATRPESLHITLAFLGGRDTREGREVVETMRFCDVPAPLLKLEDPIQLPRRGRASLFALPAPSPATTDLRQELVGALVRAGLHLPDKRDFWPHVTVARVRPEGRGSRRPAVVARRPGDLPDGLKKPFIGVRMTLYRSELQSGGSRYVPLAQVELSRPGSGR
jgi:RNA 2',3'-cyclic 3'-phosphodiesterase